MRRIDQIILSVFLLLSLASCSNAKISCNRKPISLQSPDGTISTRLTLDESNAPCLMITMDGKHVMEIQRMGLECKEGVNISNDFKVLSIFSTRERKRWERPWGENKKMMENYREYTYELENSQGVKLFLMVKAFNDGIAFQYRYNFENTAQKKVTLTGESTTFQFLEDGTSWSIPANFESYEFLYRTLPISQVEDANTPFTFKLDNGIWGAIHEAELKMMPEMALRKGQSHNALQAWLCPDNTGTGTVGVESSIVTTSWRTIILGRKATDLINSSIILNLNAPCKKPIDTTVIHPMKYIGIWWGMHLGINSWTPDERHGANTENALKYIDFAAENNIDAVLFEGWNRGWEQWGGNQKFSFTQAAPDMDIDQVIQYARQKGVEVIIHHETGGNIENYEQQIDSAFAWCRERGIHYIKTGYAGGFPDRNLHHSAFGVYHYWDVMTFAKHYGFALDVHEPIKFTGLQRTYPNLMTGEGARGMEWNAWSDGNPPSHETILPFTRLLSGPMDYTPGIFDITYERIKDDSNCKKWNQKDSRECRVHSTIAHQAALWVVLYSPLQMAADLIENYQLTMPDGKTAIHPMFQFFRDFDPDCDESWPLDGIPGEYVTIARRAGNRYFIGSITNEEARDIEIPLQILPRFKKYKATIYSDAPNTDVVNNPTAYHIYSEIVNHSSSIKLHLAAGGGAAITLEPIKTNKQ